MRGLGKGSGSRGSQAANYPTTQSGVTIFREGVSIVKIGMKIEQLVSLAGDTETQRSQKTLAVIVFFVGAIITALDATNSYFTGFVALGAIYYVAAGVLAAGALCIVLFPSRYVIIVFFILLFNMGTDVAAHVVMGGYLSGLLLIPFSLLIPILAVLLLPRRPVLLLIVLYLMAILLAGVLDPMGNSLSAALEPAYVVQQSTTTMIILGILIAGASFYLFTMIEKYRRRADDLLLNMLPAPIALRLKENKETIADGYSDVTVLFADMVGSTPLFSDLEPAQAVDWLNEVFSMFDRLVGKYGLEKIRTIGDNYMVAAGVPVPREDHAQAMAGFALDMIRGLEEVPARQGKRMAFRVGIHSGPLVAGVIGESKYQYDLWGDTVNIASRMESHGAAGKVHISKSTYDLLGDEFECVPRGRIAIKGKGGMETWYLIDRRTMANIKEAD